MDLTAISARGIGSLGFAEADSADPQHAASLLRELPIFDPFPRRGRDLLASGASLLALDRGQTIFRRGATPTGIYFVVVGAIKLIAPGADGRDKTIELFGPGQMFGEIGVFMDSTYRAWAQAVGRCTLIHVSRSHVMAAIEGDHELSTWMLREVSWRVQKLIDVICATSTHHGVIRVASYLLDLAEASPDPQQIELPAPKHTVASLLSLTHESFSRIMRKLSDESVIAMRGRTVRILDMAALRRLRLNQEN
jgi:CRP-like cAMP-binding protein